MQVELSTLKNNNARLTSALQESTSNVEEWKRQLHNYKVGRNRIRSWRKKMIGQKQDFFKGNIKWLELDTLDFGKIKDNN